MATGVMMGVSRLQRYRMHSTFPNMVLSGTLYTGSVTREWNVLDWLRGKYAAIARMKARLRGLPGEVRISTQSSTAIPAIPDNSIDYIFTDPPFGGNLGYSELSFIWEAWLRVFTDIGDEAVINRERRKGLPEYTALIEACFKECHRILKPGRWMTVEFHNSQDSVWNAITDAIAKTGFVIADIRVLDKKQRSFKQVTAASAVRQDLLISAYKPRVADTRESESRIGDPETAWAFARERLAALPPEADAERRDYLLFDRMVAFHIMNNLPVPLDAHGFYAGLRERFAEREGRFYLRVENEEL
jgi:adenine-specific DNA methylase